MSLSFDEPVTVAEPASDPTPAPDAPATPTPAPAPAAPAERTYSQAEFDRHMSGLRKAERDRYERELERARQTRQEPSDDPLAAAIAPLRQEVETFKLDRAKDQVQRDIERLQERYKDFDQDAVVQHALDIGTTNLEAAYKSWNHDRLAAVDVEKIRADERKKAIAEYTAKKEKEATEVPSPEGNGGTSTIAPAKDFRKSSWDEVDAAATATIRRGRAAAS